MLGRGSSSCLTHPKLDTSSASSSGCSRDDRFGKHFQEMLQQGRPLKASALPPKCLQKGKTTFILGFICLEKFELQRNDLNKAK